MKQESNIKFNEKSEGVDYVINNYSEVDMVDERLFYVHFMNNRGDIILTIKRYCINNKEEWELIDERKQSRSENN